MKTGSPFGIHRVIEPLGVMPQGAWKIDNTMEIVDNEILIDVSALNIDAASFTQIKQEAGGDVAKVAGFANGARQLPQSGTSASASPAPAMLTAPQIPCANAEPIVARMYSAPATNAAAVPTPAIRRMAIANQACFHPSAAAEAHATITRPLPPTRRAPRLSHSRPTGT